MTLESDVMGCDQGLWRHSAGAVHTSSHGLLPAIPRAYTSRDPFSPSVSIPEASEAQDPTLKTAPAGSAVTRGPFVKNTSAEVHMQRREPAQNQEWAWAWS